MPSPAAAPAPAARADGWPVRDPRVIRTELLAGLVVALALIPEAISFSVIAGVDPAVGLYASFTMAVTIAIVGGRPAMISAATAAMAVVVVDLVKDHGVQYLFAAAILAGALQIVLGRIGAARLMRFVSASVMTGFVNSLAILIFAAQLPHLDVGAEGYAVVAAGLVIIFLLPRLQTVVPAPLVAIVVLTAVIVALGVQLPTVGDEGELPASLPALLLPDVPFSLETLEIIAPYSATLAVVGLIESLLTQRLVDDIVDENSSRDREAQGQGIANIVTGFFGGMPGCAMIGQTMINVRVSGARTRLSTFAAGAFLLILIVVLQDLVAVIPMTALVAVMVFVSWATFDWHSIKPSTLRAMPAGETVAMVSTVAVTVATANLALGVGVGVLITMAVFSRRVAHLLDVDRRVSADGDEVVYRVSGELFFASGDELAAAFHHPEDPERVVLDLAGAHLWDSSAVAALEFLVHKYERSGRRVELRGMSAESEQLRRELAGLVAAHE